MEPETPTLPTAAEHNAALLAEELRRHDLLPGAAETLARLPGWYPHDQRLSRGQLAEKVAERLAPDTYYARYLNPEAPKPPEYESSVRTALRRFPELREDKREELMAALGPELHGQPICRVVAAISAKLDDPQFRNQYATTNNALPMPVGGDRVVSLLGEHFPEMRLGLREEFARSFASHGLDGNDETVVRQIAGSLKFPKIAEKWGVPPIRDGDYRLRFSRTLHGARDGATPRSSDPSEPAPRRMSLVR